MTHPLVRVLAALVGAIAIWRLVFLVVPDGYTHALHAWRAVGVLVPVLLLWWFLSRATGTLRTPTRRDLAVFGVGAVAYLLPTLPALVAVLASGVAEVRPTLPLPQLLGQGTLLLALVLAFEAIPEELIFRDLVQTSLARMLRPWLAVVLQAALFTAFGAAIGAGLTADRLAVFVVFALVQGTIRQVVGSVGAPMGFHAAFQLTAQWLLGGSWDAWAVRDPQLWLAGAIFVPAALLGPLVALAARRWLPTRP